MIAAASTFLLALCLTLYPLAAMWYNTEHQSMIHTQYERVMEQVDDSELRRERQLSEAYNVMLVPGTQEEAFSEAALLSARNEYANRLNFSGDGIMGYVRIPKIQAVLPIYHGTSETTLEIGVGHLLGSSLPIGGASTHTVLTGHSGMASQKMFSDLPDLELGSLFYLDVLGETLAYQVDQIETVLPHDSSLLEIVNGEDHCTLVTCTPFGVNTHRLLVILNRENHDSEGPEITIQGPAKPRCSNTDSNHTENNDNHPVHSEMQFSRLLNSSKVTDHHAIIPTKELAHADLAALPSGEHAILQLIAVRFLCALADDYCYSETEAHAFCAGEEFSCKSKEVLSAGWHSTRDYFYPPAKKDTEKAVSISEATTLPLTGSDILSGKTQAPKRYTEDSLLSAMQNAAKEDIPAEAERQGIGTPATRAGIIEKLIQKGYVERSGGKKGKSLIATAKGNALITIMPEQIQSASMTADWEQRLLEIERGEYSPAAFIGSICAMIQDLINTSKIVEGAEIIMAEGKIIGTCPRCGAEVVERQKGWFCANRSCRFILWKDNAFFQKIGKCLSTSTVEHLLLDGHVRLKDCKNKATGKVYNATLHMVTEADGRPVFNLSFENGGNKHDGPNE